MKRLGITLALVVLFAAAYGWFSFRNRPAQASAVAPSPSASVAADPKRAAREELFGAEAVAKDVQWRESGLGSLILAEGGTPKPGIGARVKLTYVGRLKDGTVFDRADQPVEFLIGTTIPGLSVGLQMLGPGGTAVFFIPPSLGYGHRRVMGIPADSGLIFDVQIVEVNP